MNIIENWAELWGKIISIEADPSSDEFLRLTLRIEKNLTIPGFENLVNKKIDEEIAIKIKKAEKEKNKLKPESRVNGLVRVAGLNNYFFKQNSIKVIK